MNLTVDDDIKYECQIAALKAIDAVLNEHLPQRSHWILDKHLPDLLPAIDRAINAAILDNEP